MPIYSTIEVGEVDAWRWRGNRVLGGLFAAAWLLVALVALLLAVIPTVAAVVAFLIVYPVLNLAAATFVGLRWLYREIAEASPFGFGVRLFHRLGNGCDRMCG